MLYDHTIEYFHTSKLVYRYVLITKDSGCVLMLCKKNVDIYYHVKRHTESEVSISVLNY